MNGSIPIGASHIRGKVQASGARIVGRISSPARIRGKLSMPQFVGGDYYKGDYIITPKTTEQIMATKDKTMADDVTIKKIPSYEVTNESGGTTFVIGRELNG